MKTTRWILAFCMAWLFASGIKAQTSCATAVTYTYPLSGTVTSYTNTDYWFKVTTPAAGSYQLNISNGTGTGKINKALIYTGSCSGLTLFDIDSISDTAQTYFSIHLFNTASTTYYIDLRNSTGTDITFNLSTIRQLYIGGQLTYQNGDPDTLFAMPLGASGTPSYTWMPGGAHTARIIYTATVSTTYTLTYSDGLGTLSDTATARPRLRVNCELVQNGDFESMQNNYNGLANVATPYGCGPPPALLVSATASTGSDPAYWTAPTCGTSDYYNTVFNTPFFGVGVPNNAFSNSTGLVPHSGNGYAGLITFGGYLLNYREYIQESLTCPLATGQLYKVSYWVSLASGTEYDPLGVQHSFVPSNNIGAYFSASPPGAVNSNFLNYTPQVNANNAINNPNTWTQVSGTVLGAGQQFLTIGNFYDDPHTSAYPNQNQSYYFIDDISVTPATPTISVSSCQSGSVTLTAYGAASANTTWYDGTTHYSGNPLVVASPSSATTFTCTVTLGTCITCPTVTASVIVQPAATCGGTQPTSYTPSSVVFNPTIGYFTSNMTINSGVSYTINCADVRMSAGTSITVQTGGTLVIKGSWLHACNTCTNTAMWQGIILQNGSKLIMTNSTDGFFPIYNIIEDAVQAVNIASGSTGPTYTISYTMFNKNTQDIYVDANTADLSANPIYKSVFTCRNIANHSLLALDYVNTVNDIAAATLAHPSVTNPTDVTIAGARTTHGIYIKQANVAYQFKVGGNSSSYSSNLFDNLDYGIYANQSSLTAINNVFQNLTGNVNTGNLYADAFGVGIYSNATATPAAKAKLIVGNATNTIVSGETNTFKSCLVGVVTKRMRLVYVNNNVFTNETSQTLSVYTTNGTYNTGYMANYNAKFATNASITDQEQLIFANNNVQDYYTGHYLDFGTVYNANSGLISGNIITATPANSGTYGVYMQQSGSYGYAGSGSPINAVFVTTNTITAMNTSAIYALNVNVGMKSFLLQIYNNGELSVKYNPALTALQTPRVAAISLNNSESNWITYNPNIRVTNFTGTNVPNQFHAGIYLIGSTNCVVNCNTVSNTGEDIVFESNCATSGSNWQKNNMDYSKYGLVLRNTGILGNQGSATVGIDDIWGASAHFTDQTFCDGSDPGSGTTTSKLYTQATSCTYQPCTNANFGGGSASYGSSTLLTASGSNPLVCGAAGTGDRLANNTNQVDSDSSGVVDTLFYQNIQNGLHTDTASYPAYDTETRWALQYQVSSHLPGLTAATGYSNAKTFALADAAFSNGDYTTAASLRSGVTPANTIESNWQSVSNLEAKLLSDTLNSSDVSALQGVAGQCYLTGGNIVWRARAILNSYYGYVADYPNACLGSEGSRGQNATTIQKISNGKNQLNLYPNPSTGKLYISNFTASQKTADIEVTDISGKLLTKQQSPINNGLVELNLDVTNGVYFVKVIANNGTIQVQKIVINK